MIKTTNGTKLKEGDRITYEGNTGTLKYDGFCGWYIQPENSDWQEMLIEDWTKVEKVETKKEKLDFGDYCKIEMKRHGSKNEFYIHKVIGRLESNSYVNVPIDYGIFEGTGHQEIVWAESKPVLKVVQCGISEYMIFRVAEEDVKPIKTKQ